MKTFNSNTANFRGKNGKPYLVVCPRCNLKNYLPSVSSGICAFCGYDANREVDECPLIEESIDGKQG